MSHANAALTPKARLKLGRLIIDVGWSVGAAADYYLARGRPRSVGLTGIASSVTSLTARCIRASCRTVPAGRCAAPAAPGSR